MAAILSNVTELVTSAISWVGLFLKQIAGVTTTTSGTTLNNPVLFLFVVAVPLCGIGVGLLRRLIHTRG